MSDDISPLQSPPGDARFPISPPSMTDSTPRTLPHSQSIPNSTSSFNQNRRVPSRSESVGGGGYTTNVQAPQQRAILPVDTRSRPGSFGGIDSQMYQQGPMNGPDSRTGSLAGVSMASPQHGPPYISNANLQTPSLPPPSFPASSTTMAFATAITNGLTALDTESILGPPLGDPTMEAMPIFGSSYNRSPFALNEDFVAWMFNSNHENGPGQSPMNNVTPTYTDGTQAYYQGDPNMHAFYQMTPQPPTSVRSLLNPSPPIRTNIISEEKRATLLDLIRFYYESDQNSLKRGNESLFEGDTSDDNHILSLRMMELYIGSYWYHCHPQMPILHRPTFSADQAEDYLLLAVMAIGAASLDKRHGREITDAATELANLMASHIRWGVFSHTDFNPPAKLWIFQTLLLLETYEKLYTSRKLHERAHIHHDTTLTLMRRGHSLIGKSAFDSPPSVHGRPGSSGSQLSENEELWNKWIRAEATKRVAFAAFILDSVHATMFGHSAKLVAHEISLPLPYDEALWSAPTANDFDVVKRQAAPYANRLQPPKFLDSLKDTILRRRVYTNSFGRTILMAGLLNVQWHMNQRDLQLSHLGIVATMGGRDKWKSVLCKAYDHWRSDFETSLAESSPYHSSNRSRHPFQPDEDNIFESRTVLHHLAHIASNADVVECQIFAGAGRLLGRSITPQDYNIAYKNMRSWASKPSSRDATFHALKMLSQVLLPEVDDAGDISPATSRLLYSARDDYLFHRPWVIYFAALVVWSYSFALEGHIDPAPPLLDKPEEREADMREYLTRINHSVRRMEDLEHTKGLNQCLGLMLVLQDSFKETRWELMKEACVLLGSCVEKLRSPNPYGVAGNNSQSNNNSTNNSTTKVKTNTNNITSPSIKRESFSSKLPIDHQYRHDRSQNHSTNHLQRHNSISNSNSNLAPHPQPQPHPPQQIHHHQPPRTHQNHHPPHHLHHNMGPHNHQHPYLQQRDG